MPVAQLFSLELCPCVAVEWWLTSDFWNWRKWRVFDFGIVKRNQFVDGIPQAECGFGVRHYDYFGDLFGRFVEGNDRSAVFVAGADTS